MVFVVISASSNGSCLFRKFWDPITGRQLGGDYVMFEDIKRGANLVTNSNKQPPQSVFYDQKGTQCATSSLDLVDAKYFDVHGTSAVAYNGSMEHPIFFELR